MPHRMAASLALLAFAACLVIGGIHAGNPFGTTVWRALLALAGTYVVALLLGLVAQRVVNENIETEEQKIKDSRTKVEADGR